MPQPTLDRNATKTVTIHVTNLTAEQARFLSGVINLFADPIHDQQMRQLMAHKAQISYGTGGHMNFSPKFGEN